MTWPVVTASTDGFGRRFLKLNRIVLEVKTALWIYFGAISILCVSLSIAISWFDRMVQHAHPRALLPWPTQMLIDYRLFLYAVPLPSLLIVLWFSFRGGLDAPRTQIVGAFSFFLLVLLVCITLLTVMILFLPWGIVFEPPR